jgi:uncharacterized protein YjbJ (UPF0337 family)
MAYPLHNHHRQGFEITLKKIHTMLLSMKGTVKMISGRFMQTIGKYTSNHGLYFAGKRIQIAGEIERKYTHFKYMIPA